MEICTASVSSTNQVSSAIPFTRGFSCSQDSHRTKYCAAELSPWWITRLVMVPIGIFWPIWRCQLIHWVRSPHATYKIGRDIVLHVEAVLAVVGRPRGSVRIGWLIPIRHLECAVFTCFRDITLRGLRGWTLRFRVIGLTVRGYDFEDLIFPFRGHFRYSMVPDLLTTDVKKVYFPLQSWCDAYLCSSRVCSFIPCLTHVWTTEACSKGRWKARWYEREFCHCLWLKYNGMLIQLNTY